MNVLSWKSNAKHAILEYLIKEIDSSQDLSRSGITNRAIVVAKDTPKEKWPEVAEKLPKLPKREDILVPTAMQAKPDNENEESLRKIESNIKNSLGLKTLQTQYEIQLLWINYLEWLKIKAMSVGNENYEREDLSGPDMVKRLVQILLLNRESDVPTLEKVKAVLLEWRK